MHVAVSSSNLPAADELQLDLCLAHGGVEDRLTESCGRSSSICIEQLENAAFARVVADLSNPLDLIGAGDGRCAIPFGRLTSLAQCRTPTSNFAAEGGTKSHSTRLSEIAARVCDRPFRVAMVE